MTQPTPSLARFLLERITEDEAAARGAMLPGEYPHYAETAAGEVLEMAEGKGCAGWGIEHFKRHTPPRILAECEAKRRIVERARELIPHVVVEDCWYTCTAATEDRDGGECCDDQRRGTGCDCGSDARVGLLLKLLAAPYADHPDFDPVWAV